jgi:hypothetical protein
MAYLMHSGVPPGRVFPSSMGLWMAFAMLAVCHAALLAPYFCRLAGHGPIALVRMHTFCQAVMHLNASLTSCVARA